MNTLRDLRATLDQHAGEVHDDPTVGRVAAVAGRARVVRHRRAAGIAAAAVVAVGAAGALSALPGERDIAPAAPDAITAVGWTYRVADTVESEGSRVRTGLDASQLPRLVSWATEGADQRVEVLSNGERVPYEVADFGDFVWLPPGFEGEVTVTGSPGLTLVTYELDESRAPEGVGEGALTYREDVAGLDLVGAGVGVPGQASVDVAVDLPADADTVWTGYHCEDLPADASINVSWVGEPGAVIGRGCDGSSFDPGASGGLGFPVGRRAGEQTTMRIWVTRGGSPVADGEIPDLQLGLGAYVASEPPVEVAGIDMLQQIEDGGHVWELVDVAVARGGQVPRIETPSEGTFLVADAVRAEGRVGYATTVDGSSAGGGVVFVGTGGGGSDRQLVGPGSEVSLRFDTPRERVAEAGLALYRRVD